jgi:parvulin-like peptidyl-prolyl isomerase
MKLFYKYKCINRFMVKNLNAKKGEVESKSTSKSKSVKSEKKVKKLKIVSFLKNKYYILIGINLFFFIFVYFMFIHYSVDSESLGGNILKCEVSGDDNLNIDSNVVAVVNGKNIYESEFNINTYITLFSQKMSEDEISNLPKEQLLNQTILFSILFDKATDSGFLISRDEVVNSLDENLLQSGMSLEEFKLDLVKRSFTYDDLIDFYVVQRTIMLYLTDVNSVKLVVSDEEVLNFYNSNDQYFNTGAQIQASHILLDSEDVAKDIIKKLGSGKDFVKLAEEFSIGPSGPNGGDLGFFGKGAMVPEFEAAVFALENINDYTIEPVKTQFGYHVIKLMDRKDSEVVKLDDIYDKIYDQLVSEKQAKVTENLITEIMSTSDIKIN